MFNDFWYGGRNGLRLEGSLWDWTTRELQVQVQREIDCFVVGLCGLSENLRVAWNPKIGSRLVKFESNADLGILLLSDRSSECGVGACIGIRNRKEERKIKIEPFFTMEGL